MARFRANPLRINYNTYGMSKLTLSVDDAVISRAKRYAREQGISLSKMLEGYLAALVLPSLRPTPHTPVLLSVRGVLKKADLRDYRRHLAEKYRLPNKL